MDVIEDQVLEVKRDFDRTLDELLELARQGEEVVLLERKVWLNLLRMGRAVMSLLLSAACWRVAERKVREAGVMPEDAQWRRERACHGTLTTTFGAVAFCWHMVRMNVGGRLNTLNFAQPEVLPAWNSCRSSPLLVEWESALAAEHPFRNAAKALEFFTHGAVDLEDTTIAAHAETVGKHIDRQWLYRRPDETRRILRDRATTDVSNGLPVVYFSCDATSLRRYVDDGWLPQWKNANGLRIWCMDRQTGELIHIGGEHTWGDCNEVERIFHDLDALGILPFDGDFGGLRAQLVFVSDGAEWFEDHIMLLFDPDALTVILDAWHVTERLGAFAATFPASARCDADKLLDAVLPHIIGTQDACPAKRSRTRKGHKKRPRGEPRPRSQPSYPSVPGARDAAEALLNALRAATPKRRRTTKAYAELLSYLEKNAHRIGYAEFAARGLQVGSGPMESLHRSGPQLRIKRPGAKWLGENSVAICNLRMLQLAERWDEFWAQPGLQHELAAAFQTPSKIPIAA